MYYIVDTFVVFKMIISERLYNESLLDFIIKEILINNFVNFFMIFITKSVVFNSMRHKG